MGHEFGGSEEVGTSGLAELGVGVVARVACVEVSKCQGRGDGRKIADHGDRCKLGMDDMAHGREEDR